MIFCSWVILVISVPPPGGSRSQLRVRIAPRPPAPFSETNNGCQIKFELSHVSELHTLDQFWQLVVAVDPAPTLLGALDKLEDHGERSVVRQTASRSDGAVPDGGKGAFNGVRRS